MKKLPLISTIRKEILEMLDKETYQALIYIENENFELVAKKLKEEFKQTNFNVSDDYLERGFQALQQYYAIAVIDKMNMHAVSDVIDPFWHMHILFTQQYCELSNKMLGHYMHHQPLDHSDDQKLVFVGKLYQHTLDVYNKTFLYYDEEFYPKHVSNDRLVCTHGQDDHHDASIVFAINPDLVDDYKKYGTSVLV